MDKQTKILQVNKLYYPFIGGIEQVVEQISEGLAADSDIDMKVLVCNEKRKTIKEVVHGVEVIRTGSIAKFGNLPLSVRFLTEFKKQAKDRNVLFFHMPYPVGDFAYFLSGIRNKRIIIWWHSDVVRQKKMMILYRPLMEWFLKKADRIIVATQGHIDGSEYLKPYKEKCTVIPFGIRKAIEEDSQKYLKLVKRAEDKEKIIHFLFVGRLIYYKGCDVLLKAFEGVKNAELVIAGDGNLKEELKQYVKAHHMEKKVFFKANLSDEQIMEEYRNCDVLVLPSVARSEAFGLVQIEAMAYGKPVINTNLPSGVPYVSLDKVTGLTVKSGDVEELRQAMIWLIENPREREQFGKAARKRVEENFLLDQMIQKVKKVCKEC